MKRFLLFICIFLLQAVSAQTPPQVINKLCAANTFFSQIQPGPNNIQCTQPAYSGLTGLPAFIRSIQFLGGSVSLVGDAATPGANKFYGTDGSGARGFYTVSTDVNTVGTIDSATPSLNGAVISGNSFIMQSASATRPGLVNNTTQSFSGNKIFTGTIGASNFSGASSGTNTGDVPNFSSNGLTSTSQVFSLGLSSSTTNGALSSSDWITFDTKQDALTFTAPLINTDETVTCRAASGSVSGCLSATDWNTFNNKQGAGSYITALTTDVVASGPGSVVATIQAGVVSNSKLATMTAHTVKANNTGSTASPSDAAIGSLTESTSDVLTITGGTNSIIGSGLSIEVTEADSGNDGYLSSTDWSTFNAKQPAGSYLTALTGDGAASGPGSATLTLATVNSQPGTYGAADKTSVFTVNGKGLITASNEANIQIAESQVTNLISDLAGKQPTGNYITALSSDVVASGPGSATATIQTGVVSNSKLATMAAHTAKINATAGTASPTDVATGTVTEATSSVLTLSSWSNATIGSPTIQVKQSSTSQSGYLSSTDWNTFNGKQDALTFSSPLVNTTGTVSCNVASGAQAGCLSSSNWTTFNNKQNALSFGDLTDAGTDGIIVTNGAGSVIGSGTSFAQHVSDSTHNGYLSSTDWSTFNGKQASGNYLTALTGDGAASGPGSAALTLATVNSNVGSFGSATSAGTFTVNAKGLITAASSTSIQIAESQVTNLVSDLAGKQATGNYMTALTGDVTAAGPGSSAATIGANKVLNSMLAQIATQTFKGRTTASTGNVEDLTATQATAILNSMVGDSGSGGTKGLVPAPASGDATKVLTGAGTFVNEVTNAYWSGSTGSNAKWQTTSSSFGDGSNTNGNTLTTNISNGISATAGASNVAGITFTPASSTAIYMVKASFTIFNTAGNNNSVRLTDGTSVVDVTGGFGSSVSNVTLSGPYAPATGSAVTLKLQIATGGGTCVIDNENVVALSQPTITWSINRIK